MMVFLLHIMLFTDFNQNPKSLIYNFGESFNSLFCFYVSSSMLNIILAFSMAQIRKLRKLWRKRKLSNKKRVRSELGATIELQPQATNDLRRKSTKIDFQLFKRSSLLVHLKDPTSPIYSRSSNFS